VVIAGNGKEALAAYERTAFDLILMDVQMPEMDGFAATRAIREREALARATSDPQSAATSHIPIVAMTAHAMKGDRERCLEAGMDSYVAKPLRSDLLFEVLESVAVPLGEPPRDVAVVEAEAAEPAFDREAVLARVEGDQELLREIVALFLGETPELLRAIQESLERRDATALERNAHALKGSVGNFGAKTAYEIALKLETMGRAGDLSGAPETFAELEAKISRLELALAALKLDGI
jgi:CheY-like chemotaxis protein